jgi:replicative DNA helicase
MAKDSVTTPPVSRTDRVPPNSEEAERGVLGSVLLDPMKVMDLCIENQLSPESFYVPAHRVVFGVMLEMTKQGTVIDALTVAERIKSAGMLDGIGGSVYLDRLIDSTPTAAHAAYYIDIVRQKHLLRCVISCARDAENECYTAEQSADLVLGKVEQSFFDITEHQHGFMVNWTEAVKKTMDYVEKILHTRRGLSGISTGFGNLDKVLKGLRQSEMIVLAARPSMGKTSLAMNIAENIALGAKTPDKTSRPVGIFSLEMSQESLVLRMLCSHAGVSAFHLSGGFAPKDDHAKLVNAASVLSKAPIYLDDTAGLDILELRARARRMKKQHSIELIVVDYLQLLHSKEYERQGRQLETADISGNLKAMAKELKVPVLVLSQLNRAPERSEGKPRLSDLRDSGAIEQDADVVCLLRRPCRIEGDADHNDESLAIVDIAKHRNGPTADDIRLNFDQEFTRFRDRIVGVDGLVEPGESQEPGEGAAGSETEVQ